MALPILKAQNVIHYDIKPENIFYIQTKNKKVPFKVVLGDFGVTQSNICNMKDIRPIKKYALSYRPYELIKLEYDSAIDKIEAHSFPAEVWAMGCTIYRMITGHLLFKCVSDFEWAIDLINIEYLVLNSIWDQQNSFDGIVNDGVDKDLRDFLNLMLVKDPKERATPSQLLKHSYFDSIRSTMENWYKNSLSKITKDRFIPTQGIVPRTEYRQTVLNWALGVGEDLQYNIATIVTYIDYIERFLVANKNNMIEMKSQLQCILSAFMYIASLINEPVSNPIIDYVYISDSLYTESQIFGCTLNLLHLLDWKVNIITIYELLHPKDITSDLLRGSREIYSAFHSLDGAEVYAENFSKEL